MTARKARALAALGAMLSGAGGMALQTGWYAVSRLTFGDDVWSSALVTGACMAGMGVGAVATTRVGGGTRRAFVTLVAVELAAAVLGLAVYWTLPQVAHVLAAFDLAHASQPLLVRATRFACAFALLLMPSAALGMALPLWARPPMAGARGHEVALVYGAETLGALAGTLGGVLWAVPTFGIRASVILAAALCGASAAVATLGARVAASPLGGEGVLAPQPRSSGRAVSAYGRGSRVAPQLAAALLGAAMIGLEVAWVRLFGLFLSDTHIMFAGVLASVLAGLSTGSLAARTWVDRGGSAGVVVPVLAGAAVAVPLGVLALPRLLAALFQLDPSPLQVFALQLPVVFPVACGSGAGFVLLAAQRADERFVGQTVAANAFGGAIGAAATCLVVIPWLGVERSLFALSALLATAALAAFSAAPAASALRWPTALVALLGLASFPFGSVERFYVGASLARWRGPGDELLGIVEGASATLALFRTKLGQQTVREYLVTNSYAMSSNDFAARRYMRMFVALPAALHPRVEIAAVIGLGLGTTVKGLVDLPQVRTIDVLDNSPETMALVQRHVGGDAALGLRDRRVRLLTEDGRHYLLGTEQRYDLITGEPPPPHIAGVAGLYSKEFFALLHSRLKPGGHASYWLPLINISPDAGCRIIRAFCAAFSDCTLWDGSGANFVLLGSREPVARASLDLYTAQWREPALADELARVGLEHPVQLAATFVGDAPFLARQCGHVAALEDDRPAGIEAHAPGDGLASMVAALHDSAANRARFLASGFVGNRLPERSRESAALFEQQRLFNDLLSGHGPAFTVGTLHQVLAHTPFQLPALMLVGSDSDRVRAAGGQAPREVAAHHALAAALAERRLGAARIIAQQLPAEPLPGLWAYLAGGAE